MLFKDIECGDTSPSPDNGNDGNAKGPELLDIITDKRLVDIFKLFDKNGTRMLFFSDVAVGLYHATQHMDDNVRTTMGLLMIMEEDDKRTLGYEQFGRPIMAIVAAAGSAFDDIAEDLAIALTYAKKDTSAPSSLVIGDEVYAGIKEMEWEVANKDL